MRLASVVDEGIEDRRRRAHAGDDRLTLELAQAEPLAADRRHVARERRVGGHESGVRQAQKGRQRDQVVTVGAQPVQQDDQLLGLAAGGRRHRWAVEVDADRHRRPSPLSKTAAFIAIIAGSSGLILTLGPPSVR